MPVINNISNSVSKTYGWGKKHKAEDVLPEEDSLLEDGEETSVAYKMELTPRDKSEQAAERDKAQELNKAENPLEGLADPSESNHTEEDLVKMKKSYIEMLMKSIRMMSPRDYTGKSWSALLDCIKKAVAILNKGDASADELGEAEQLLHRGLAGLRRVEGKKKEESNSYKEIPCKDPTKEESPEGTSAKGQSAASIAGLEATSSTSPLASFINAQGSVVTGINLKI